MFCEHCGAKLPDDSRFCVHCGAKVTPLVDEPAPQPAEKGVYDFPFTAAVQPLSVSIPTEEDGFAHCATMTEAAGIAIARNSAGEWSYWDDPTFFSDSAKRLLRFCQKEDKCLSGENENVVYLVSPGGAVGHAYREDDGTLTWEWVFYSPTDGPENLPVMPECR